MSNGEMIKTLKDITDSGQPLEEQVFRSLSLSATIEVLERLDQCWDKLGCIEEKGTTQSRTNKEEIDRLRNRNNLSDVLTAIAVFIAGLLGLNQ